MKHLDMLVVLLIPTLFLPCSCASFSDAGPEPSGSLASAYLRCEYLTNPLGIEETAPRLSWIVESARRAQRQTAYRILVAGSLEKLNEENADLWDSGKMPSDATAHIVYAGKPLTSRMRCVWKVRVWDAGGAPSPWSAPAFWTMGLLEDSDWQAAWIGLDRFRTVEKPPVDKSILEAKWIWFPEGGEGASAPAAARFLRRSFQLPQGRKVKSATCTAALDNSGVIFVNGEQVAMVTSFKEATQYDITRLLRPGTNVIAIEASNAGTEANPAGALVAVRVTFTGGEPLVIRSDADWRTSREKAAGWKDPAFDDTPWSPAKEIGAAGCAPWGEMALRSTDLFLPPPPCFRKPFTTSKAVRSATVYASALGIYELHLNGRRVGDDYFTPGWTDYDKRVYYNTYDVTGLVREGDNVIGAVLADGWYSGYIGWGRKRDHFGDKPRLRVQLHVKYDDGSEDVVATDATWKAATGPIRETDFLMGEVYDAREELPGWDRPGFDAGDWQGVDVTETVPARVQAYPGVTVRAIEEVAPRSITEPKPGVYVFDLGRNFAGFVRLQVAAPEGTEIVLRFAERLNPDGTIYTVNLRGARAMDTYICRGGGEETWEPRFTFHGFQYVEVSGFPGRPGRKAITGIVISSDTPVVGAFECSDPVANRLYGNICTTQRSNFIDIPTDCPQRDERLGWTGDAQIYVRTATYNTDAAAFFTKWLVDLVDARLPDGAFPDVAPRRVAMAGGTAAWGDAGVVCPWTIHEVYGDLRVLKRHYDALAGWIEYCRANSTGLLRPAKGYGDWLSIRADTPKDVLATAYFAYSTSLMARVAGALGKQEDTAKYEDLFEQIREAFNKAYVAPDARIKGDTQTVYVLALAFDLLPPEKRPAAVEHLVADVEKRGWHLSTGFVGTKDLMQVLTRFGRTDVAYRLFEQDSFPSWRFSIKHGATSIWERWDGWTPEKGFQDPGMNSFAHYSFGAVAEWMFKTVGGIDTEGTGFGRLRIHPRPGGSLTHATVSYNSIHGPVTTSWKLDGKTFSLEVTIPANTTATVVIPAQSPDDVTEGGAPAAAAEGVKFLRAENGEAVYEVGSGSYSFVSSDN